MGKSSKDKRDIYYRLAKEEGWRARSAFKLLQIDEEFNIFQNVKKVVDLCAAPGSWSQVLAKKLGTNAKIIAVDLQDMAPIDGVIQLKGDITDENTARKILSHFDDEKVDLVVCDGAPDVTGYHDLDEFIQHTLLLSALNITTHLLKGGHSSRFVAKIFRGSECDILYLKLRKFFDLVTFVKPSSSRNSSVEAFAVCEGYNPPQNYVPSFGDNVITTDIPNESGGEDFDFINRTIIPFLTLFDKRGFDSDTNYPLQLKDSSEYTWHPPVQEPINPPYKEAIAQHKNQDKSKDLLAAQFSKIKIIDESEYKSIDVPGYTP